MKCLLHKNTHKVQLVCVPHSLGPTLLSQVSPCLLLTMLTSSPVTFQCTKSFAQALSLIGLISLSTVSLSLGPLTCNCWLNSSICSSFSFELTLHSSYSASRYALYSLGSQCLCYLNFLTRKQSKLIKPFSKNTSLWYLLIQYYGTHNILVKCEKNTELEGIQ